MWMPSVPVEPFGREMTPRPSLAPWVAKLSPNRPESATPSWRYESDKGCARDAPSE